MSKELKLGSWITVGDVSVAEVMADAGFDWLCIDLEHSVIDYAQAHQLIIAVQGKGIKAFVRIGENSPLIIKRILDAGVDGIIIPNVKSLEEAKKAVNSLKYPPIGERGVGLARAQGYGFGFDKYLKETANNVKLILQIEHYNAINDLESILQLEGVDGTFIGPYDLSGSLGKPGKWDDEEVIAFLEKYEATVKKFNKLVGYHVVPPDYKLVIEKLNKGYNFIAFSFDLNFLGQMIRNELKLNAK
jgi:2-dehydro-3-deoxyglucarate aldolase